MIKAADIEAISYVQRRDNGGTVPFGDLSPAQKREAATELKRRYCAELLRGTAEIKEAGKNV